MLDCRGRHLDRDVAIERAIAPAEHDPRF